MPIQNIDNDHNDPPIGETEEHSRNHLLIAANDIIEGNLFFNLPSTLEDSTFNLLRLDIIHIYVQFVSTMQRALPKEELININRRWRFGDEHICQGLKLHKYSQLTPSLLDAMFGRNYSLLEHYELIKETEYQTTIHIASAERLTSLFCMKQEFYLTGPNTYLDKFDNKFLLCGKVYFKSLNDDGSVGPSETIGYIINDYITNCSHKIIVSLAGSNRTFEMQRP